jgi:hypothetical protein
MTLTMLVGLGAVVVAFGTGAILRASGEPVPTFEEAGEWWEVLGTSAAIDRTAIA